MPPSRDAIERALSTWNVDSGLVHAEAAERERQMLLHDFPLTEWPSMPLDRYAIGTGNPKSFCRLMEFGSHRLGRIGGGSASKHIIYRRRDGGWYLPQPLRELPALAAWERLREDFITALRSARSADVLDSLPLLRHGQTLVMKSLYTYEPETFLPVYGEQHLRHFISLLGGEPLSNTTRWRLNLQLSETRERHDVLSRMPGQVFARFLYDNFDPRDSGGEAVMIAPGKGAFLWPECLKRGVIRIGYPELGDLTQYAGEDELRQAIRSAFPLTASSRVTRLTKELAQFRGFAPGDKIVANHGQSRVLAVGTVTGEGYFHDDNLPHYKHCVSVDWDESFAQVLAIPLTGHNGTFYNVGTRLWRQIQEGRRGRPQAPKSPELEPVAEPVALTETMHRLVHLVNRKGVVILDGPPGTGKTRLALDAALAITGRPLPEDATADQRRTAIKELLTAGAGKPARAVLTTFHPTFSYEDFVEGFKPSETGHGGLTLERRDGLFTTLCRAASGDPDTPYVLIVDEINRADLPRVLGELVTVLEKDKRGLPVTLPVSGRQFHVPANVSVIGTMNTSDRSVSALDSAIRRRFGFFSVLPDPGIVAGTIGVLDLEQFLRVLNSRIRTAFSQAQELGHAFLLRDDQPLASEEDLHSAFYHDVAPMVQELTLDDPELLAELLGTDLFDPETRRVREHSAEDLPEVLASSFGASFGPSVDA